MRRVHEWADRVQAYPLSIMYVVGLVVAVLITTGDITLGLGAVTLTGIFIGLLLISIWREVSHVHMLVNSQRDLLLARIDQLERTLRSADIEVPQEEKRR